MEDLFIQGGISLPEYYCRLYLALIAVWLVAGNLKEAGKDISAVLPVGFGFPALLDHDRVPAGVVDMAQLPFVPPGIGNFYIANPAPGPTESLGF